MAAERTEEKAFKDVGKTATTGGLVGAVMLMGGWIGFGDMPKQLARVEREIALIQQKFDHIQNMDEVLKSQLTDRVDTVENRIKNIAGRIQDLENAVPRRLPDR